MIKPFSNGYFLKLFRSLSNIIHIGGYNRNNLQYRNPTPLTKSSFRKVGSIPCGLNTMGTLFLWLYKSRGNNMAFNKTRTRDVYKNVSQGCYKKVLKKFHNVSIYVILYQNRFIKECTCLKELS